MSRRNVGPGSPVLPDVELAVHPEVAEAREGCGLPDLVVNLGQCPLRPHPIQGLWSPGGCLCLG
eukprot:432927-Lingulodinium_polyedra.AAC.1